MTLSTIAGILLLVVGGAIVVLQWLAMLARAIKRDERGTSLIPLLGPALCVIGLIVLDAPGWTYPLPFVVDLATILLLIGAVASGLRRLRER